MNKWDILGIQQTKDKEQIKNAYRNHLISVNPEDDPDGFMVLRNAYEEALAEAEHTEQEPQQGEGSPLYLALSELYADFQRRIDANEWKKIFSRDEFVSIDTEEEARLTFLSFFMEHYFVPQPVYRLIVETFHIQETREELLELFPEDYILHILNNAKYKDRINYTLFENVNENIDDFIGEYYNLCRAIQKRDIPEEERLLEKLDEMGISHPYLEISRQRYEFHKLSRNHLSQAERLRLYGAELQAIQEKLDALRQRYSADVFIILACGDVAFTRECYEEATACYEQAAEVTPNNPEVMRRLGDVYSVAGAYEKARDIFMELLDMNNYDVYARTGMMRANEGLMEKLEQELQVHPEQERPKLELAWCYYRNLRHEESVELLHSFTPGTENKGEYYGLLGRNYLHLEEYEQALTYFLKWKEELDSAEKPGVEPKEKYQQEHAIYYIGECYLQLKQYEQAELYLKQAMQTDHDFQEYAYEAMCQLQYECGNYEACIRIGNRLLEQKESYLVCLYQAKSYDRLTYYSSAVSACERAIQVYPYLAEPFALELKIFRKLNQFEMMGDIIERFEQLGYNSDQVLYYKAELLFEAEQYEACWRCLNQILSRRNQGETDLRDYEAVYRLQSSVYERMKLIGEE